VLSSEGVRTHSVYATVPARPTLQFRRVQATTSSARSSRTSAIPISRDRSRPWRHLQHGGRVSSESGLSPLQNFFLRRSSTTSVPGLLSHLQLR
jgi:hypothetical protein